MAYYSIKNELLLQSHSRGTLYSKDPLRTPAREYKDADYMYEQTQQYGGLDFHTLQNTKGNFQLIGVYHSCSFNIKQCTQKHCWPLYVTQLNCLLPVLIKQCNWSACMHIVWHWCCNWGNPIWLKVTLLFLQCMRWKTWFNSATLLHRMLPLRNSTWSQQSYQTIHGKRLVQTFSNTKEKHTLQW